MFPVLVLLVATQEQTVTATGAGVGASSIRAVAPRGEGSKATTGLHYTFSPQASLQLYAQPFISKGSDSRVRELRVPRADAYDDHDTPYGDAAVAGNPGGFNVTQFRSNAVFWWEYRPGSTVFLVWSQRREANQAGFGPPISTSICRHLP